MTVCAYACAEIMPAPILAAMLTERDEHMARQLLASRAHRIVGYVCCRVLQGVAGCCRVLQGVVAVLSYTPSIPRPLHRGVCVLQCVAVCCSVLQCVAVRCSMLQCVAVCCSVLQCVAV